MAIDLLRVGLECEHLLFHFTCQFFHRAPGWLHCFQNLVPLFIGASEFRDSLVMYLLNGLVDVLQKLAWNIASRFNLCD